MNNIGDLRVVEIDVNKMGNFDKKVINPDDVPELAECSFNDIQYYEGLEFQEKALGYKDGELEGWSSYDMLEDGTWLTECTPEQIEEDIKFKVKAINIFLDRFNQKGDKR